MKIKNKQGISLIVLIITIVVIIILATAIIVNIAQTNLIENANEAVLKQDFKTFQDELTLYIADQYADTLGKFKAETLDATKIEDIEKIIPSIKGTKYEEYVAIEDGKIAISDSMPEPQKTWAMESLGLIETSTNRPTEPEIPTEPEVPTADTTAPTVPTSLESTSTKTSITSAASGSTDESNFVYEYSIDNTNWQENGEFTGLTAGTLYTVYARAKDEAGNTSDAIEKSISTKYNQIAVNAPVENENATVYGEKPSYNNPVIPVGFKAIETTDATWADTNSDGMPDGWNNGLVIQDGSLNEFVWVPCTTNGANGTIQYTKNLNYPSMYSATSENTSDDLDALPNGIINETDQIKKYGGFYIGRYEAGVPANQTTIDGTSGDTSISKSDKDGIPVVKKDATVWTYISYNKAMPNAKLFINTANVKSGIVTGTQWDTVCTWINSETNDVKKPVHSVTNSKSWGNYNNDPVDGNNGKKTAGFKEEWKAKNIYDLAGNTEEWTGESNSACRICRGGNNYLDGSDNPAAYRSNTHPTNNWRLHIFPYYALYNVEPELVL